MKFSAILAIAATVSAIKICDPNNKAGNPLCDQDKEIETSSDRKWKKLKRSQKVVKITKGENKAKQAREVRKEREGQLKARAAARALRNHIESQKKTLAQEDDEEQVDAAPAKQEESSESGDEGLAQAAPAQGEEESSGSDSEGGNLAQEENDMVDDIEDNLEGEEESSGSDDE